MSSRPMRRTWRRFYHDHGEAMRLTLIGAFAVLGGLFLAKSIL